MTFTPPPVRKQGDPGWIEATTHIDHVELRIGGGQGGARAMIITVMGIVGLLALLGVVVSVQPRIASFVVVMGALAAGYFKDGLKGSLARWLDKPPTVVRLRPGRLEIDDQAVAWDDIVEVGRGMTPEGGGVLLRLRDGHQLLLGGALRPSSLDWMVARLAHARTQALEGDIDEAAAMELAALRGATRKTEA